MCFCCYVVAAQLMQGCGPNERRRLGKRLSEHTRKFDAVIADSRRFGCTAKERERPRPEIAATYPCVVVAKRCGHCRVQLRVVETKARFGVGYRARQVSSREGGSPCGVMGLK